MKQTRLRQRSDRHSEKDAEARDRFADSKWVYFDEVRLILGEDKSKWPRVRRRRDPRPCRTFHMLNPRCWITDRESPEAHHMAAGFLRGKTDELCVLTALSREWHDKVNTKELPFGRLLWLKWKHDWLHCDWVRTTLLFGSFLPDLIPQKVVSGRLLG